MSKYSTNYDVCIIGSGVAGALVAYKLGRAGIRVVILEAGPRHDMGDRDGALDRYIKEGIYPWKSNMPERDVYTTGGKIELPLNDYTVKAVGGSTLAWMGYSIRMHDSDFEMRTRYGIADDWPLKYSEIEKYYCEAEEELGVAGDDDNPFGPPRSKPFPMRGFPPSYAEAVMKNKCEKVGIRFHSVPQARNSVAYRGRPECEFYSECHICPTLAKYSADVHIELAEATRNVTVVPNANVVRLEKDNLGKVKSAIYASTDKIEHSCKASIFVLAAGAVESSRILLLSKSSGHPDGLANSSGLVGRYLMEHAGRYRWGRVDYPLFPRRLGFYTLMTHQFYNKKNRDRETAFVFAGKSTDHPYAAVVDVIDRSGNWGSSLEREIREGIRDNFGRVFTLASQLEPMPMESNRVELDPEVKDCFGNPCPKIYYDISSYERESLPAVEKVLTSIYDAMGAKVMEKEEFNASGGHFGGTCRMGNDSKKSVVDRNLKAHDVANMYIAGQSVMVTEGCANPCLTNAALSLRLADHLIRTRGR